MKSSMSGECHGHLFMDGIDYLKAKARFEQRVDHDEIRRKLKAYADAGVTFYRDGGDPYGACLYASRIAGEYGIDLRMPVFAIHKNGHYGKIVGKGFDSMSEYSALVKEAAGLGADFIKIMCSGIMRFDTDGCVSGKALSRGEIREMVHIAHEEGFAVMAHVNGARAVLDTVEAGADSIEHGNGMDEDCIQALEQSGAVWVPTLSPIGNLLRTNRHEHRLIGKLLAEQEANVARAYAAGVYLAAGSDAGAFSVPHVQGIADETAYICEAAGTAGDAADQEMMQSRILQRLAAGEERIRRRFRRDCF